MESETIELARPIDPELGADIVKQSVYVSTHVRDVAVADDGRSVRFRVTDAAERGAAREKMTRFVDDMVKKYRKLARKILACHAREDAGPLEADPYRELVARRWVLELGRGQAGLAGPALALARALDAECAALGRERFEAAEEAYPALIPSDVLGRCGYFASFPHAVSMVTHLVEDYDAIETFRRKNADSPKLVVPDPLALPTPEACLVPAVCYHCYESLEGRTLDARGHVATSVGKCFRYESGNIVGLDRLWDFTMREVIFVGTEEFVFLRRQKAIGLVEEQLARWDLDGTIETANDPFFPTTYATKTYWQIRSDLKFELRLAVAPAADGAPRSLACGSFNLHESFFGDAFRIIAADGKPAFTGCVGWGLERWVLACFTQHGFEPSRWPEAVRRSVFG